VLNLKDVALETLIYPTSIFAKPFIISSRTIY